MRYYDKEKEVRKRSKDPQIIEIAKGILRFEANNTDEDLSAYSHGRFA